MRFGKTKIESVVVRLHEKTEVKPGRKNRVPGDASSGRADQKAEAETSRRAPLAKRESRDQGFTDATEQGNESLAAAALVRDGRKPSAPLGKRTQNEGDGAWGNPSVCFVELEYGPGRTEEEANAKHMESPSAPEEKPRTGWNQHRKSHQNVDFRSKQEHQEHTNSDFFRGNPTWFLHRGGLRPPTLFLIETKLAHSKTKNY
jgi:hypothetical protein